MNSQDRGELTDAQMLKDDCARHRRNALACDLHLRDLIREHGSRPPDPHKVVQPAGRLPKLVVGPAVFPNRETLATLAINEPA